MRRLWFSVLVLLLVGAANGAPDLAAWAQKEETKLLARVKEEPTLRRQQRLEMVLRQRYEETVKQQIERLAREGAFASPEIEALRAERLALIEALKAVEEKIFLAGYETPEVKAQLDALKRNTDRVNELQSLLYPEEAHAASPAEGGPLTRPEEE